MQQGLREVPIDDKSIMVVSSMTELINESFGPDANVILLRRKLKGDFNAAAKALSNLVEGDQLYKLMGMKQVDREKLMDIRPHLKGAAGEAVDVVLKDMKALQEAQWEVVRLRLVYPSFSQDFHPDGGDVTAGTTLCCYTGPTTEGLLPQEQERYMAALPGVKPFSFRIGDIWRHACVSNATPRETSPVEPFIHRAPESKGNIRLLLVADRYNLEQ